MPHSETSHSFLEHAGHRVAVLSGNPHAPGMPLVFLHGIAGSVHFWPTLLPPNVSDDRRWHSIGLPYHWPDGYSPLNGPTDIIAAEHCNAQHFAEILAAVIRQLSPTQPVALIGYSTGGFAALNLAARAPELVTTVVSVSGFAVGKWHGQLGRLQALASRGQFGRQTCAILWSLMTSHPAIFRRLMLRNAHRKLHSTRAAEAVLDVVALDAIRQPTTMLAGLFASIRRYDIRPLLDKIRVPVMIAGGDRDPIIRYEHTCELAAEIRTAELVTFRDVGHLFFVECLDLFHRVLEDWIERHCSPCELQRAA